MLEQHLADLKTLYMYIHFLFKIKKNANSPVHLSPTVTVLHPVIIYCNKQNSAYYYISKY